MQVDELKILRRSERFNQLVIATNSLIAIYDITQKSYIFATALALTIALNCWCIIRTRKLIREIEND